MIAVDCSHSVVDSHTAGHPTRVILSGIPPLQGQTVLEKRDFFRSTLDNLRPRLLHEPAGHAAMVGLVPVPSMIADFGAFFISSYVYLDMCGHGTLGYAATLAATGSISAPRTSFTLETPAGVVSVGLAWAADGALRAVRIRNVPCRVGIEALAVHVPGLGLVTADIVYGGIWYAIVDARAVGIRLAADAVAEALLQGSRIKEALCAALAGLPNAHGGETHPSVLFYASESRLHARHMLVLESNKFDRSPCGTGSSARLALMAYRGEIAESETYVAENLLGTAFHLRIAERVQTPHGPAIIPEVEGMAFITAFSTIVKQASDPLARGFLCR